MAANTHDSILYVQSITSKVLKNIARKEWSAALGVFSALKHITLLQPDIGQACDKVQRQQLNSVVKTFEQTVKQNKFIQISLDAN